MGKLKARGMRVHWIDTMGDFFETEGIRPGRIFEHPGAILGITDNGVIAESRLPDGIVPTGSVDIKRAYGWRNGKLYKLTEREIALGFATKAFAFC
jgi:hypothetical protein